MIPDSPEPEIWYRFEDATYATLSNAETESWSSRLEVKLRRFRVVRHTSKGVWLALDLGDFASLAEPRFVLHGARKRYACPTPEEARASFVARKRAQIRIYEARARRAREALIAFEAYAARPPHATSTPHGPNLQNIPIRTELGKQIRRGLR